MASFICCRAPRSLSWGLQEPIRLVDKEVRTETSDLRALSPRPTTSQPAPWPDTPVEKSPPQPAFLRSPSKISSYEAVRCGKRFRRSPQPPIAFCMPFAPDRPALFERPNPPVQRASSFQAKPLNHSPKRYIFQDDSRSPSPSHPRSPSPVDAQVPVAPGLYPTRFTSIADASNVPLWRLSQQYSQTTTLSDAPLAKPSSEQYASSSLYSQSSSSGDQSRHWQEAQSGSQGRQSHESQSRQSQEARESQSTQLQQDTCSMTVSEEDGAVNSARSDRYFSTQDLQELTEQISARTPPRGRSISRFDGSLGVPSPPRKPSLIAGDEPVGTSIWDKALHLRRSTSDYLPQRLAPKKSAQPLTRSMSSIAVHDQLSKFQLSPAKSAWTRYPIHGRYERANSLASTKDQVAARDFALEKPAQPASQRNKLHNWHHAHSLQDRLFPEARGHRGSVSEGLSNVEYPELEMVSNWHDRAEAWSKVYAECVEPPISPE